MPVYEYEIRVAGISQPANKRNAETLRAQAQASMQLGDLHEPPVRVQLVPQPDNKYDPNCVQIAGFSPINQPMFIGSVPARRYCPVCNPLQDDRVDRGYPSYGDSILERCPIHGEGLSRSYAEQIAPILRLDGVVQDCLAYFYGQTEGKANIGARVRIRLTVPDSAGGNQNFGPQHVSQPRIAEEEVFEF